MVWPIFFVQGSTKIRLTENSNSIFDILKISIRIPHFISNFSQVDKTMQKYSTLLDLLQTRAENQAQQTAYTFLIDGETEVSSLTYQELQQQAQAIAASLQSISNYGERALLLYPSGLEFIAAFFGCIYAGVIAVPAYPPRRNQNLSRLKAIVADAQATIVLTTTSLLADIKGLFAKNPELASIKWISTDNISVKVAFDWEKPKLEPKKIAFLQYTSGSTGTPKGVMVSHQNILHNERLIQIAFEHTKKTIFVGWLPLFHDMGLIGNVLQPLYLGIPSIFMSPVAFLQKPVRWLQAISRYRGTTSGGPNFAYELCTNKITPEQLENCDLSSWEIAFNGAEPIRAETLDRFANAFRPYGFRQKTFYTCYGMAETTLFVSGGIKALSPVRHYVEGKALEHNQVVTTNPDNSDARTIVSSGLPLFDKIVIVEHQSKTKSAHEKVGEIWVMGLSVARGYWNKPEVTQGTFNAYLNTGEGPFLRTGDLGFIRDGELFVTGRLKDVIIIRGRNYYPQDIELTVEKSHLALRNNCGAAFSVEIESQEELVIAVEVKRTHLRKLNVDQVVTAIRQAISEQYELKVYGILLLKTASLPKTSSGKVQRHICKVSFLEDSLKTVGSWVKDKNQRKFDTISSMLPIADTLYFNSLRDIYTTESIQNWIVSWLSQELNLNSKLIDPYQSFSSHGVDSVVAVELAKKLGDYLKTPLKVTLAWDFPTINSLAHHLAHPKTISSTIEIAAKQQFNLETDQLDSKKNEPSEISEGLEALSESEIAQLLAKEIVIIQDRE
jgi:acyl-CoA synthetase (AMP-forming)/AMP-acid ligase II/acyl carrier protein